MELKERIIFTFNKFYSNLIKDLKSSNEELRKTIKKNYKVIDKFSSEYCEFFFTDFTYDLLKTDDFETKIEECYILKEIKVADVVAVLEDSISVFMNYIYILSVIGLVYKDFLENDDSKQSEVLYNSVMSYISAIQRNEDATESLEEILDDDIKRLLLKIRNVIEVPVSIDEPSADADADPFENLFGSSLKDSKICNLAKEISKDIDVSSIKVEKPEDILKMMDFSSSNNILGNIIKQVSTKIHDKISNGELKQEDLFGEAMSMMSGMQKGGKKGGSKGGGSGNSMADMMGMMGSMMGGAGKSGGGGGGMADIMGMMGSMMGGAGGSGGGGMGDIAKMMSGMMGAAGGSREDAGSGSSDDDKSITDMLNNPMMNELLKQAKKGKTQVKTDAIKKASVRDRLRTKLEARKKVSE